MAFDAAFARSLLLKYKFFWLSDRPQTCGPARRIPAFGIVYVKKMTDIELPDATSILNQLSI